VALAVLLALGGLALLHLTRGTEVWVDEWVFATQRRHGGLESLLHGHNGHLSLVPLLVYRALFATAGLNGYLPYRVVGIASHLLVVALLFAYVRRRVGPWPALAAALLLLAYGPAWQDILWPFQVGWLLPLACGLGALLLLDRRDRIGDVLASVLLVIALACSGIGVPVTAGVALDLALTRRSWRAAPIAGVPLALYALWWVGYQDDPAARTWSDAIQFAADSAASTVATLLGLTGLGGPGAGGDRAAIGWGRPLLIVAAVLVGWRLHGRPLRDGRAYALLAVPVAFWLATGVERSFISTPETSRYLYVGGLFVLLLAAELGRGLTLSPAWRAVAVIAVAAAAFSNIGVMRKAADDLRLDGARTRAVLGAVELEPGAFPDARVIDLLPGYPFAVVHAGQYRSAARDLGSPADDPASIAGEPAEARSAADRQLALALIPRLDATARRPATTGVAPAVDGIRGGAATPRGGCVVFRPAPAGPVGPSGVDLTLPAHGLAVSATAATALKLRRFADDFPADPLAQLRPGAAATLELPPDRAPQPWHLRLDSDAAVTACGL
jgi:hypothetical protein